MDQQVRILDHRGKIMERSDTNLTYKDIAAIIAHENRATYGEGARQPFSQNVWVYACINMIAQSFSQIPIGLWIRSPGAKSRKRGYRMLDTHPILDLLEQPNEYETRETFLEAWVCYLLTGGNVWIYKDEFNSMGIPRSLILYGIDCVQPLLNSDKTELLAWKLKIKPGKFVNIPLEDMIHFKLPNPYNKWMGMPPHVAAQLQLDADRARTVFDKAFFANNASPDAVLIYKPGPLGEDQRSEIRASWNEFHQGAERAGGLAVVGGDFDFKQWGVSHAQSQFLQNRQFTREEIASIYCVPVNLLNASQKAGNLTREGLAVSQRMLYDFGILPHIRRFITPMNISLTKKISPDLLLDFDVDTLPVMSEFLRQKAEVLNNLVKNGVPLNQAILMLDLSIDPISGGDKGYLVSNMAPLEALAKITEIKPKIPDPTSTKQPPKRTVEEYEERDNDDESGEDGETEGGFFVTRLRPKIKRFLFTLRTEVRTTNDSRNPFNLVSARKEWVKTIYPICLSAMQYGLDSRLIDKVKLFDKDKIDKFFRELQIRSKTVRLSNESANTKLGEILTRSICIIDDIWSRSKQNTEEFDKLNIKSRDLATEMVLSCINAGRNLGL